MLSCYTSPRPPTRQHRAAQRWCKPQIPPTDPEQRELLRAPHMEAAAPASGARSPRARPRATAVDPVASRASAPTPALANPALATAALKEQLAKTPLPTHTPEPGAGAKVVTKTATAAKDNKTPEPGSPAAEQPDSPASDAGQPALDNADGAAQSNPSTSERQLQPVPPARAAGARPGSVRKVSGESAGTRLERLPSDGPEQKARPGSAKRPPSGRPKSPLTCPICLEAVAEGEGRSTAALACGHRFHLSCIGSAFNAKGAMVCPLCRAEEEDEWKYADGLRQEEEWDPTELGEDGAALFYPSDEEYDDEYEGDEMAEYWCEELPVLWRIHAAPLRYVGELSDEEPYPEDEHDEHEDEPDDGLDDHGDDDSIDEEFDPRYTDEDDYAERRVRDHPGFALRQHDLLADTAFVCLRSLSECSCAAVRCCSRSTSSVMKTTKSTTTMPTTSVTSTTTRRRRMPCPRVRTQLTPSWKRRRSASW